MGTFEKWGHGPLAPRFRRYCLHVSHTKEVVSRVQFVRVHSSDSTRCRRTQRSQLLGLSLHSQSVHSKANDSLRLAHSLPPQLKLCALLSATTKFTNYSTPKPKVHRMWYDCFPQKPNVCRKCPFVHIRRRNRNRNRSRNSVDL